MDSAPSGDNQKQALIEQLDRSRAAISSNVLTVANQVDVPARLRRKLGSGGLRVAAASAIAGLAGAALVGQRSRQPAPARWARRMIMPVAGLILDGMRRFLREKPQRSPTEAAEGAEGAETEQADRFGRILRAIADALK